MWSTDFSGHRSAFNAQQRLLYPVRDSNESTKKDLFRVLQYGTCTGVAVLNADDRSVLQLVKQTLQGVFSKKPQLNAAMYTLAVTSGSEWAAESIPDRIRDMLGYLHVDKLDVLLLARPESLGSASLTTSERKRAVLLYWEVACAVQRLGLARDIGLSDFTIQEMEFIFTASSNQLPIVLSIEVGLASGRAKPATPQPTSFRAVLSFAHGRHLDVVARFPFQLLDDLPAHSSLREQWKQVAHAIAARHKAKQFDVPVVHEAEKEPYHLEKSEMKDTQALQTNAQIILRYFIQKGLVVVPLPDSLDNGSDSITEEMSHEIFYTMAHPFTSIPPTHSPQNQYSSILSKEDIQLIDQVLPLVVLASVSS